MDLERVLKYCSNSIEAEKKKPIPSLDTIRALERVINFAKNADTPQEKERIEIIEIFKKHHKDFKGTHYVVTKKEHIEIDGIIIQMKQEMEANIEQYSDMTVGQFFELFMTNMDIGNNDDWWKRNHFTTWGINKQFRKILSQVISGITNKNSNNRKSNPQNKPSYSDILNHNS